MLAAGAAGAWLLVNHLRGHGDAHPLPWRDLTAQTGRLVLPRAITREFISHPQLAGYLRASDGTKVPRVDFPSWRAVLITLGPRSTTAYSLRVVAVTEERDRVVVSVRRGNASLEHPGRARLTFPYRLITIPTTHKTIHLRWVKPAA